jgi:hypothetical protein
LSLLPSPERPSPSPVAARAALAVLAVVSLVLAPLWTGPADINGDTSWLLHVVEQMMAGRKAYVDLIETNPPMAFLIYWPAVASGRIAGVSPETSVYAFTAAVGVLSIWLVLWIARRSMGIKPLGLAVLGAALAVVFFLAPSRSFTQREHLALMLFMPAIMTFAVRASGGKPDLALAIAGGLLAGLGASIKPHFALVIVLPAVSAAFLRRDWRILFAPEAVLAGVIVCLYALAWLVFFPEFFDLPLFLVRNTYRLYVYRLKEYFQDLPAILFVFTVVTSALLVLVLRRYAEVIILAAGLAGFAIAFIEQGKGFAYHLYPVAGLALILAAFIISLGMPERANDLRPFRAFVLLATSGVATIMSGIYSSQYPDSSGLRRALLAEKAKPSIIILSFDIAINFPLVRQIGAKWASRLQSTWISNAGHHAMKGELSQEQRTRTQRAITIESDLLAADITRNRPDLVVFDTQITLMRMRETEDFRTAFDGAYAEAGTAQDGRFLIYRRTGP